MVDLGRINILGSCISALDYERAVQLTIDSAKDRKPLSIAALAVHGLILGVNNRKFRRRLNGISLVLPDGQPIYWLLRYWKKKNIPSRVYGPEFMSRVIEAACRENLSVYFYGSTQPVLSLLTLHFKRLYPKLKIAGFESSKFRRFSKSEQLDLAKRIQSSGADMVFVGLGCPRQEYWVYEYSYYIKKPLIAVGAAFNYHAGLLKKPYGWVQKLGLEWLFRFMQEPKRLAVRYLLYNSEFLLLTLFSLMKLINIKPLYPLKSEKEELYA